jgi:hypothetical protein
VGVTVGASGGVPIAAPADTLGNGETAPKVGTDTKAEAGAVAAGVSLGAIDAQLTASSEETTTMATESERARSIAASSSPYAHQPMKSADVSGRQSGVRIAAPISAGWSRLSVQCG